MITSLLIIDFQVHRKEFIEFGEGITVIVAPNDKGKSSILRLLRFISLNKPSGDSFVNWNAEFCKGTLILDGEKVKRVKGKGLNTYWLGTKDYHAFGQGNVPQDISKLINLSELSFQKNHDPPFWLKDTPGKVAKELNTIVNLSLIDDSLAYIGGEVRKARATVDVGKKRLREARERRDSLRWAAEYSKDLSGLESLENDITNKRNESVRLCYLLRGGQEKKEKVTNLSKNLEDLERVSSLGNEVEEKTGNLEKLTKLLTELKHSQTLIETPIPDISHLQKLENQLTEKKEKLDLLTSLLSEAKEKRTKICEIEKRLSRVMNEMKRVGLCPTCGKVLN